MKHNSTIGFTGCQTYSKCDQQPNFFVGILHKVKMLFSINPKKPKPIDRIEVVRYLREEACRDVKEPWNAQELPRIIRFVADYLNETN